MSAITLQWERYTDDSLREGERDAGGYLAPGSLARNGRGKCATIEQAIEALQRTDDEHAQAFDWCYVSVYRAEDGTFCLEVKQRACWPVCPIVEHSVHFCGTRREAKRLLLELSKANLIGSSWSIDKGADRGYLEHR